MDRDEKLQHLVANHFKAQEQAAPPFEQTWSQAHQVRDVSENVREWGVFSPGRIGWAFAVFALVAVIVMVSPLVRDADDGGDRVVAAGLDDALFQQLAATTQWSAPSDRLLTKPDYIWGVPELVPPNSVDGHVREKPQWL